MRSRGLFYCVSKTILFNILLIKYFLQITYLVVCNRLLCVNVLQMCCFIDKKNIFL